MSTYRFNLTNRLLHWSIALTILFILLTVFLRQGWMNKEHLGEILQASLEKMGITISTKQAILIGKDLRRPMWVFHTYAGYLMIGLYLIRIILIAVQGPNFKNPLSKIASSKDIFTSLLYIIFYGLLGITLFTGLMLVYGPKEWKEFLKDLHVQSLYYVCGFIFLHICGVILADRYKERGLISKMISGDYPKDLSDY